MTESNLPLEQSAPTAEMPAAAETPSQSAETTPAPAPMDPPAAQPRSSEEQRGAQTWYLLNCLAAAPDRQLKWGDIKRKGIIKKAREVLNLTEETAEPLLETMKQQGYVQTSEKRGTVVYELTDAGEQMLGSMQAPQDFADMAVVVPVSDEVLRYQQAYLLLDLLSAPDQTLSKSQANSRISKQAQSELQLTPAVAGVRRNQLVKQGYIEVDKQGRQESYHLTADGRDYLAALEQHPNMEFKVRGDTFNKLLAAARETPARDTGMSDTSDRVEPELAEIH